MALKIFLIIMIIAAVGVGAVYFGKNSETIPNPTTNTNTDNNSNTGDTNVVNPTQPSSFSTPKKSAHYESNTPHHGAVLAAPPVNIAINFNFDLAPPSSISVTKDGKEYTTGFLVIDSNKLSMRKDFVQSAPNGKYKVTYNACWPDKTCHDGHFEFAIDRSLASSYEDQTLKSQVTIRMSELMFKPKNIRVSKGAIVYFVNDDNVVHYVNTDNHPEHTYYPTMNSRALNPGERYSYGFEDAGIYPYHCSAHAHTMTGNIIVE